MNRTLLGKVRIYTLPLINDAWCLGMFINSHHPKIFDLFKDVISGIFPIRT